MKTWRKNFMNSLKGLKLATTLYKHNEGWVAKNKHFCS